MGLACRDLHLAGSRDPSTMVGGICGRSAVYTFHVLLYLCNVPARLTTNPETKGSSVGPFSDEDSSNLPLSWSHTLKAWSFVNKGIYTATLTQQCQRTCYGLLST